MDRVRVRPWWIASLAVAVLLVGAAVLGRQRPGGFVVLSWVDHPFLFGVAALSLLALACWLAVPRLEWRLGVAALLVVLAVGWAALGVLAAGLADDPRELSRHPRGDREVVVYRGSTIIDPTWELRLLSGTGLATREWDLGCVNSDTETFGGVGWTGPSGLRVSVSGRAVDIALDETTGQPDRIISAGC
jgi:hypothetical protein